MSRNGLYNKALGELLLIGDFGFSTTVSQSAPRRVRAGTIACKASGRMGMIATSKKGLDCTFKSIRIPPGRYVGHIQKFGLGIGVTKAGVIVRNVFETGARQDNLSGSYVGATAEATFAAGPSANVLVGGSQKTIASRPLSVTGQTELNVAAGVGQIALQRSQ